MATLQPTRGTHVPEIRKGDRVIVLSGKDVGKQGVVERVIRREASRGALRSPYRRGTPKAGLTVVVEGINIAKRHTKPRQTGSQNTVAGVPQMQQGGILDIPQPLPLSKVMLVCPRCDKPTRVKHTDLASGQHVRICRNCGEPLEVVA